eukprot:14767267-Alexandrium_andersonii.AAC.1
MPTRPVPEEDDDALVRREVAAHPPQAQPYVGQLPPGVEGVAGPLPASRPIPAVVQSAAMAGPAAPPAPAA